MKHKLGALLLLTTSLHASDHYNAEQCANFRNNAHLNLVINRHSFKPLPAYLNKLELLVVPIPFASEQMQYTYMTNFIGFYNTTLFKASSEIYCSLYGKKNPEGHYYNEASRCAKVHEHLTDLITKFEESYDLSEATSDDLMWEKRLLIKATGEFSIRRA